MKLIVILITILFFDCAMAQEDYTINAESGLNVRVNPDLSSEKVAKIPFGVTVEKLSEEGKSFSIKDNGKSILGKWVKIRYNNYMYLVNEETEQFEREGYVFDAYLKKKMDRSLVHKIKIEASEFDKLKKTARVKPFHLKKVTNLDSIKTLLKDRVVWLAEADRDGNNRDDAIESITVSNGQKLIVNQVSNDYGFDKDWSGYFPEYDILVLEGGHASDMCFSIATGETDRAVGNPNYMVPSPQETSRLNGYDSGQECTVYFFQIKVNGNYVHNADFDICNYESFYWLNETEFIYSHRNYNNDHVNGVLEYFKCAIHKI